MSEIQPLLPLDLSEPKRRHAQAVSMGSSEEGQERRRLIPITQGQFAIVDEEDFERLSQFKWYAFKRPNTFYARRVVGYNSKWQSIYELMQHTVLGSHAMTDHKDRNGLNNCKRNLRPCTTVQNAGNSGMRRNNSSGFKGVAWNGRKWMVSLRGAGKTPVGYLGVFEDPVEAAKVYDAAARIKYGEFALLNFP